MGWCFSLKVIDILNNGKVNVSCELFPPKVWSQVSGAKQVVRDIAKLSPSFMSVTYGAGGTTDKYTTEIASNLLKNYNVTPIAHLTCVGTQKNKISDKLKEFSDNGIENILALRGDIPDEGRKYNDFTYAS